MRLSDSTGDYSRAGGIVDRQQVEAIGGETQFTLSFIDGAEEVYKNGSRLFKGAANEYTTDIHTIILTTALIAGDELILVGRSSVNYVQFTDGQVADYGLITGYVFDEQDDGGL